MEMGLSGGYNYDRVQRSDAPAQQGFHDARAESTQPGHFAIFQGGSVWAGGSGGYGFAVALRVGGTGRLRGWVEFYG